MRSLSFAIILTAGFLTFEPAAAQIAVQGEIIYTMAGEPIQNGVVLINDGKIEQVGTADEVQIPDGYKTHSAKIITPGFIDARTVVGLAGIYNIDHDQDALERSSPLQPELRAFDAYNPREQLVEWLLGLGITTMHTGHAPGALASGQTMIVKTGARTVGEAIVDSVTAVSFTLGPSVGRIYTTPGTRSKGVAMLRSEFIKAQEYLKRNDNNNEDEENKSRGSRDLRQEIMGQVLNGEVKALITAHRATEILTAIRLADEFGFDLILDGASEAYLVLDEIKAAGIPVIIHPTMIRTRGETENATFETAARLKEAGIPFAFQSGYEGYVPKTRVVLYEAAIAIANGLDYHDGLAALTIDAARILGIDSRVGSLEAGKDADLVLFPEDPFEYTTLVDKVIVNGKVYDGGE